MHGGVSLIDPTDGSTVIASAEGAEILLGKGFTEAPPAGVVIPAPDAPVDPVEPDPVDPSPAPGPAVKDPAAPRGNASRDAWVAYAEQIGLQVADEDSREDIKSAVADLEK